MKKFTIFKNCHYSMPFYRKLFGFHYNKKQFFINFKFSNNCYWSKPRNIDDYDLNKLFGISFGMFSIHKNSVRLVWVPNFEKLNVIDIYGYTYDSVKNGQYNFLFLCSVDTETEYMSTIKIDGGKYIISINEYRIEMENSITDNKIQKEIYPYFGGNNKAINTMNIYAKLSV